LFLEKYFVGNLSQNSKMERKMYGPELVFEIFNFDWNHVLKFSSKNMAKNAVFSKNSLLKKFGGRISDLSQFRRKGTLGQ